MLFMFLFTKIICYKLKKLRIYTLNTQLKGGLKFKKSLINKGVFEYIF